MAKIALSYRRADSKGQVGRIYDRLAARYGASSVFIDIDSIPVGIDFREHIQRVLAGTDVLVAIVGPNWLGTTPDGSARISSEDDPLRVEVETALRRGMTIVPVLIEGASMPTVSQLPDSIKDFAYRNAIEVALQRDFRIHMDRLIHAIDDILRAKGRAGSAAGWRRPIVLYPLGGFAVAAGLAIMAVWSGFAPFTSTRQPATTENRPQPKPEPPPPAVQEAVGNVPVPQPAKAEDECQQIKALLPLTGSNFESIRQAVIGNGDWATSAKVQGYESCRIETLNAVTLVCDSARLNSKAEAQQLLKTKGESLAACLGSDWMLSANTQDARGFSKQATTQVVNLMALSDAAPAGSDQTAKHGVTLMIYQLGGLAAIAAIGAPDIPRDFCQDLKRAVSDSKKGFASILGRKKSIGWASRLQLPGWFDCDIDPLSSANDKRRYYSCDLSPFPTDRDAAKAQDQIASQVKSCLGPEWSMRRRAIASGGASVEFNSPKDGDPSVEVRIKPGPLNQGWRVKLDVTMP